MRRSPSRRFAVIASAAAWCTSARGPSVAAADAEFRIPESTSASRLWTGVPRLVRELGAAWTKELVLTGRAFDAAEAHSIRFVNRVVPDVQLDAKTEAIAAQLARKSALVLTQTKQQVEASAPLVPDLLDGEADAARGSWPRSPTPRAARSPETTGAPVGKAPRVERVPITPDDKDWTWVLERTCPECGFTASAVDATDVAA